MSTKSILIADSGATKTSWVWLNTEAEKHFETPGFHPAFVSKQTIHENLIQSISSKQSELIDDIYFYGAGCGNKKGKETIYTALTDFFPASNIYLETDLLGACRALFQEQQGICAILGTGSNSAFYKNGKIESRQPSLGYILGDEGSGAYLGKLLVTAFLNGEMTAISAIKFSETFDLSYEEIIDKVYRQPFPNRFLASLCPYLSAEKEDPFIDSLIRDGLNDFFRKNLLKYKNIEKQEIRFCGSIAFNFTGYLEVLCSKYKLNLGGVIKNPIEGLVKYHKENNQVY